MPAHKKGFTLIELLVVISIIAILSAIGMTVFSGVQKGARDAKRVADLNAIATSLEIFYYTYGYYPRTDGHAYWDGHWEAFRQCLQTGQDVGLDCSGRPTISNYNSPMTDVPRDPRDDAPLDNDYPPYFYGYPNAVCPDAYRLAAVLETNHPALSTDIDTGGYYGNSGCADPTYCIGIGSCSGFDSP